LAGGGRSLAARGALGGGGVAGGAAAATRVVATSARRAAGAARGHSVSSSGSCLLGILLELIPYPERYKPAAGASYVRSVTESPVRRRSAGWCGGSRPSDRPVRW